MEVVLWGLVLDYGIIVRHSSNIKHYIKDAANVWKSNLPGEYSLRIKVCLWLVGRQAKSTEAQAPWALLPCRKRCWTMFIVDMMMADLFVENGRQLNDVQPDNTMD